MNGGGVAAAVVMAMEGIAWLEAIPVRSDACPESAKFGQIAAGKARAHLVLKARPPWRLRQLEQASSMLSGSSGGPPATRVILGDA